ncbi:MAG TPA: M14 metallopeptidase family protein [Gemmatimonadales bacterium]|nr:M14 metallopeptidase family protein [Gemmatimonadales bacterium]
MRARAGALLAVVALLAGPVAAQRPPARRAAAPRPAIPTPRSVLGFEPGDDRKLAEWPVLVRYFQALARASDRVDYRELGRTTLGAPFVAVVISSPQNLRQLDRYRRINAGLADPRTLRTTRDAQEALRTGKTVVLITSSIHSTEVGGHLSPVLLAHRLATDTSAATRAILDNVILWLVPSLNPDGVTIVSRWYNRTVGTPAEGMAPPELYHHYTGHDNNRDWYAFTQVETRLTVDSLYSVWHPQIVHDIHQMGSEGARLFVPPYLDPIEPNVDPLLVDGANALGTAMAWELAGQGKTGISTNSTYDAWTPARAYQHYHGAVRILSETASGQLASPVDIAFSRLEARARGYNPRERSWNFTNPWPGGRWTLRDIVSYQTDGAYALLVHAADYRQRWLANFLSVGRHAVQGWKGWPYAYVIPARQDSVALATLLGILARGQVEIRTTQQSFTMQGQRYASGTFVVVLRQPYAAFAKALLEVQHYPDRRLYPGGPPERPYDVTAHTLPLLFGLTAVAAPDSLRVPLSAPVPAPRTLTLVSPLPSQERGPGGEAAPRVGLYRSYAAKSVGEESSGGSIDEGWTRWVFDTWKVPYVSLVDSVARGGKLKDKFDVIVLPDQGPRELLEGLPARRYPAPYAGGLGSDGAEALRQFVVDGGTLVALNDASRFAVQALLLPVRNVLEAVPDEDFYAPGSIFRLELDTAHAVARGMPRETAAWFQGGPAFEVLDSSVVRVIGRWPDDPTRVLLSGWVLHPDRIAGKAGLLEVRQGAGRVILFGFRPQYRGQSLVTYPLLFNSLQLK